MTINWIEATEENIEKYLSDCIEDHVQFKKINFAKCDYGFVTSGGDIILTNNIELPLIVTETSINVFATHTLSVEKINHFALRSEFDAILPKKGE